MQPLLIIDLLDEALDLPPCLFRRAVVGQIDFFFLQGLEETFSDGVVVRVALAAHTDLNAVLFQ